MFFRLPLPRQWMHSSLHLDLLRCPLLHKSLQPPCITEVVRVAIQPWELRMSSLQLLIQPWISAPGTHYGWVGRDRAVHRVCPTLLHMVRTGNQNPDLLILSPIPNPLGHMLLRSLISQCNLTNFHDELYSIMFHWTFA